MGSSGRDRGRKPGEFRIRGLGHQHKGEERLRHAGESGW